MQIDFHPDPANVGPVAVGNGGTASPNAPAMPQPCKYHFFTFPPEVRNKIYREALVVPDPGVVRSFAQPALLRTGNMVRDEALLLFYAENHFEITVKRNRHEQAVAAAGERNPCVDSHAWHRFFVMWGVFSKMGLNYLQHVTRITLIYELSLDTGLVFGEDTYDNRLGFRFSCDPFEEDADGDYEEDDDSDSDSTSGDGDMMWTDSDLQELEEDAIELAKERRHKVSFVPNNKERAPDFDPVGVFELNRGQFEWPSRRDTHHFLFDQVERYGPDRLWGTFPIHRLSDLLWRCVKDCPLASQNVDFLLEDYQHFNLGIDPSDGYGTYAFYNPEDEES